MSSKKMVVLERRAGLLLMPLPVVRRQMYVVAQDDAL
jgi:hypothetical protein